MLYALQQKWTERRESVKMHPGLEMNGEATVEDSSQNCALWIILYSAWPLRIDLQNESPARKFSELDTED